MYLRVCVGTLERTFRNAGGEEERTNMGTVMLHATAVQCRESERGIFVLVVQSAHRASAFELNQFSV